MSQCIAYSYYQNNNFQYIKPTWKTNVTSLPQEIQEWNDRVQEMAKKTDRENFGGSHHHTYAQVGDTLYLRGTLGKEYMLLAYNGTEVHTVTGEYTLPTWITRVTNEYICFMRARGDSIMDFEDHHLVYCGSEEVGFQQLELKKGVRPDFLTGIGGLLWLLFTYPVSGVGDFEEAEGNAIVSLDPATMEMTFHSVLEQSPQANVTDAMSEEKECTEDEVAWYGAMSLLFLSSVPIIVSSVWLWVKKEIPSSSITLLLGVCLCWTSISLILYGQYRRNWGYLAEILRPKFLFCASMWILMSTYVLAVSRGVARAPFQWSLYFASAGLSVVVAHRVATLQYENLKPRVGYYYDDDESGSYDEADEDDPTFLFFSVLAILVFYIPLSMIGIINDSTSIFILAVVGIMLDIGMGTALALRSGGVLTAGAVVALEIIFLMAISWRVFRRHTRGVIRTRMVSYMTSCARRISGTHSSAVLDGDDEEETRESLLGIDGGNNAAEEEITGRD